MGYLTTVTIYNDGADQLRDNADEVAKALYDATQQRESKSYCIGNHGNLINSQPTRHADEHTTYVHMGNCVIEMNAYSAETERLLRNNPSFGDGLIKQLEWSLKLVKELRDKIKNE